MKRLLYIFIALLPLLVFLPQTTQAKNLGGYILLQVESRGEAWYINPLDGERYSLSTGKQAIAVLRKFGLGVKHSVVVNPPRRLVGRIMIDVEDKGRAYYLSPKDFNLYYLGTERDIVAVFKKTALGAKTSVIYGLTVGRTEALSTLGSVSNNYLNVEKIIQELVNDEREKNGLSRLKWNDDLAGVSREHSQNQADQNTSLINQGKYCSFPFIHHEGLVFGLYHADRLQSRGIYYQSASAENIALIPKIKSVQFEIKNGTAVPDQNCQAEVKALNVKYEEEVKALASTPEKLERARAEITQRAKLLGASESINVIKSYYNTIEEVERKAVDGWMNSPGHRKNILNGDYDEAGMGVAEVKGYYIITQVFIKRATRGFKGGACCQKTGYYPYCYVPWSCNDVNICS